MRLIVCLAARGIVRDAVTGAISVFHIIEAITPAAFPILIPDISVLSIWRADATDGREVPLGFEVRINGEVASRSDVVLTFAGAAPHRAIITLNGILVAAAGTVEFAFLRGTETAASYTIDIRPPAPTPPTVTVEPSVGNVSEQAQTQRVP